MTPSDSDIRFTRRALELAQLGAGRVSPNPLVGCVIVSPDGEIVGEGTYIYENVIHAEAIALAQAGELSHGATAYVSLEPHSHFGRTPPCTELLIGAGIRRIVCPIEDPNPLVSGKGFARLREASVETIVGVEKAEGSRVNEKFICWHQKARPFVHLKLAMSLDGRISLNNSVSTALSSEASRERVQSFRHEHDAILVGSTTAVVDNPSLTDRSGRSRRNPLVRVVLDDRLRLSTESILAKTTDSSPTFVLTCSSDEAKMDKLRSLGVDVVEMPTSCRDIAAVLAELKLRNIQSILVEGGSEVAGAFVDAKLVDKVTFIAAPIVIGGAEAPVAIGGKGANALSDAMRIRDLTISHIDEDVEISGYPSFS